MEHGNLRGTRWESRGATHCSPKGFLKTGETLASQRHPHRHFRLATVAPGIIGDQLEFKSPGSRRRPFPVQLPGPSPLGESLGFAFEDRYAAQERGIVARPEVHPARDAD